MVTFGQKDFRCGAQSLCYAAPHAIFDPLTVQSYELSKVPKYQTPYQRIRTGIIGIVLRQVFGIMPNPSGGWRVPEYVKDFLRTFA